MTSHALRSLPTTALLAAGLALLLCTACGAAAKPPPPKPKPPSNEPEPEDFAEMEPEPIETGKDCVTAKVECGGGVCVAHVKNDCDDPVTCDLAVMASCKTETTSGEARTKSRATFRAKTEDKMSAEGDCADGDVLLTVADGMSCQ
jgi:hypothetical protein